MTWNYRLIHHNTVAPQYQWIGLHEVHYDAKGKPKAWTEKAVTFVCDMEKGPAGLTRSLEMALKDARDQLMLIESELEVSLKQESVI